MTQPKFKVGEDVILQSTSSPELNGEYKVYMHIIKGDIFKCRLTGLTITDASGEGVGYLLDEPFENTDHKYKIEAVWHERTLKKKHPPADESFDQMIRRLNNGVKA